MARTAINYQQVERAGLVPTPSNASADGNKFTNDGRIILRVFNDNGSAITVTVQTPGMVDGLSIADRTVSVANGDTKYIGPFPPGIYNQSDGMVYVDFSAVTDVTVAALRV